MTSERRTGVDHGSRSSAEHAEEELGILRLALSGLPPRQREALALAVVHRLGTRAISDRLGVDVNTVHLDLREGLFSLRAVLDVVEPAQATGSPHVPDA